MKNLKSNYVTFVKALSDSEIKRINLSEKSICAYENKVGAVVFCIVANGHNDQGDVMIFDSEGCADHILPAGKFRQQLIDDAEDDLQQLAYG